MPKRNVVVAALVVMILLLAQSLAAQVGATYYVSTTGNDGNSGSIGAPWLTIQHAATKAKAGATVYVFGGVYNEFVNFPRSGTASAPITSKAIPDRPRYRWHWRSLLRLIADPGPDQYYGGTELHHHQRL